MQHKLERMAAWVVIAGVTWLATTMNPARAQHTLPSLQQAQAARVPTQDMLLGEWWTEGREGRIKFVRKSDGSFVGTTTCCNPKPDVNNPNPQLRQRSTVGIVLIWQLRYSGDGLFENGYVYNPRDGDTYRIDIRVIDQNTVKIRGYLGISLLGQSQIWQRATLNGSRAPTNETH